MHLDLDAFPDAGLYLLLDNGTRIDLSRAEIERITELFLHDASRLPPEVRQAADYQPCDICPLRDTAQICHAILPVLPFVESLDEYNSYDPVTVVYRGDDGDEILHVTRTTLQRALQYVSILSLVQYCEVGREFGAVFRGILPFMPPETIAEKVYLNVYWMCGGDLQRVREMVERMQQKLETTTRCQTERLRLVCRRDVLTNAFVGTQISTVFLGLDMEQILRDRLGSA